MAGAQPNISSQDIEEISLDLPFVEEQKKIGGFYNKFNFIVEKQANKVELLKQQKQSFYRKCLYNSEKRLMRIAIYSNKSILYKVREFYERY